MTYPFSAGDVPTADLLNHIGAEFLDGCAISVNPIITAAAFSSETDIPRMKLTASVVAGELYVIFGQQRAGVSNTDTESDLKFRHTIAVSGTLIGSARIARKPVINAGEFTTYFVPFAPASTNTALNIFTSIIRGTGTGNTTIEGGADFSFHGIMRVAPGNGVFRSVTT